MPPEPPSVSRRTPNPQEQPPKSIQDRSQEMTAVKKGPPAFADGHPALSYIKVLSQAWNQRRARTTE